MLGRCSLAVLLLSLLSAHDARAQNWSFDARKIGLGATGGSENLASKMVDDARQYKSIVLPLGLLQVIGDFDRLSPTSDDFDLVRTIEYAAAPLHYQLGRDYNDAAAQLVVDLRRGTLSRNLNAYRGFVPANQPAAEGLASPNWGGTVTLRRGPNRTFQGIYIGAGPYLSMRTDLSIDPQLIGVLGSSSDVYLPNASMQIGTSSQGQLALAVTGGYRGRFALPAGLGTGSERDGIYIAANYNHLRGFRYERVDSALRLDTDRSGLLTQKPLTPPPLAVVRHEAKGGSGFAADLGASAVVGPWQIGFGANGIGNHIDWNDVERVAYTIGDLIAGDGEFAETAAASIDRMRTELPVDYRLDAGYLAGKWEVQTEYSSGFQGNSFRAGYERDLGVVEVRGGAFYGREKWNPTVGVGLSMGKRLALDLAAYGTTANAERERRTAVAVSLRINP